MQARSVLLIPAAMICALSLASTAGAQKLSGQVKIDGSSTVFPITEAIAEEFQKEHPGVRVTVGMSGTGGGFKKWGAGETDINNASRPIKDSEAEAGKKSGFDFLELPVAFDGISVVVNPQSKIETITFDQLKKIWEPGSKVTKWSEVDPSWPNETLKLYGPGPDSGTFDYFTEEVMGKARASRSDYTASEDDNVLVTGINGDKSSLGYFGYAYYHENKSKLKSLKVDHGKGPIAPTDQTIENGTYPLARPVFIVVSTKAASRPEVDAFVKFYLTNARSIVKQVGYIPLPEAMYAEALKRYEAKQAGHWTTTKASH